MALLPRNGHALPQTHRRTRQCRADTLYGVVDYLAEYLNYLAFERGLSALTRENYGRDIRLLLALAEKQALSEIKSQHIRRFIATMHARGLSGRSIARSLSAWRGFYEFLCQRSGFSS